MALYMAEGIKQKHSKGSSSRMYRIFLKVGGGGFNSKIKYPLQQQIKC